MNADEYAIAIGEQLDKTLDNLDKALDVIAKIKTLLEALETRVATLERQVEREVRVSEAAREGRLVR